MIALRPIWWRRAALVVLYPLACAAQFRDDFDGGPIEGWQVMTGDGEPRLELLPMDGFMRMRVDGTHDPYTVWWTLIKRDITASLDLEKLRDPAYELRVEARVRSSVAPRRVNFMANTTSTTDFHEHLREYDLDSTDWKVISMTTRDFRVAPGDAVFVQFCATDFGPGVYAVDVDYYRADVVRRAEAGPDLGEPLVYHPPVPSLESFSQHLAVAGDSLIDEAFPAVNFNDWHALQADGREARLLTISRGQGAILRWDFDALRGRRAAGAGVLELTTAFLPLGGAYLASFGEDLGVEFGKVRIVEILGGDPAWDEATVTYASLLAGESVATVFNGQMTIDLELAAEPGGRALFTLPRPVLQRLLDGRTRGLLIRPLGAMATSIYASEDASGAGPRLHFNLED